MKYKSINELNCFQFHDAEIKEINISNDQMIWTTSAINAMTTNTQNINSKDLCIENATMIFENFSVEKPC